MFGIVALCAKHLVIVEVHRGSKSTLFRSTAPQEIRPPIHCGVGVVGESDDDAAMETMVDEELLKEEEASFNPDGWESASNKPEGELGRQRPKTKAAKDA
jgi:hypothetical protein